MLWRLCTWVKYPFAASNFRLSFIRWPHWLPRKWSAPRLRGDAALKRIFQRELHDPRIVGSLDLAEESIVQRQVRDAAGAWGRCQACVKTIQNVEGLAAKLQPLLFTNLED